MLPVRTAAGLSRPLSNRSAVTTEHLHLCFSYCFCRMAFGYLDVFGRLVFGANGLPRPLMRRDVVATPAPAQPRDPAARNDAEGAGEEGADAAAAAAAAAATGDGAQDVATDPRTQSMADAPNPVAVPEERPPLTFMGNVGNIALAFVTSLLPSWEG